MPVAKPGISDVAAMNCPFRHIEVGGVFEQDVAATPSMVRHRPKHQLQHPRRAASPATPGGPCS
eukprot:7635562-Prorocentrum_lima.AAC.1